MKFLITLFKILFEAIVVLNQQFQIFQFEIFIGNFNFLFYFLKNFRELISI